MEKATIIFIFSTLSIAVVAAVAIAAARPSFVGAGAADRPDCPGKIRCPISGEMICRDKCPRIDANRADCPGKIECPESGELVCKDRCPLTKTESVETKAETVRSCCVPDEN